MRKLTVLLAVAMVSIALGTSALAGQQAKDPDADRSPEKLIGGDTDTGTASPDVPGTHSLEAQEAGVVGNSTVRLFGANRYETAASISRNLGWTFENTFAVYLADGEGFADALALGPSTFQDGPVLLTTRSTLPQATRAELARLQPCLIIAAGGSAAISDSVLEEADAYADLTLCS